MPGDDWLSEQLERSRPRLHAVAYRMLGSHAEADDAVQETWLRVARADSTAVENFGGWLTTIVARVCLDRLRSRRARPEASIDDALPADVVDAAEHHDPELHALMAESVGAALLVVLDSLGPAERVAFVLHDVFAVPFEQIAGVLERSPEATRQLASRARRRVQGASPALGVDLVRQRDVVDAFLRAARGGDFDALLAMLDPDVVLRPDAEAVRFGRLRETHGAGAVVALLSGGARQARLGIVDGVAGLVWAPGGRVRGAVQFTVENDRIVAINVIGDAGRLRQLDIVIVD